MMTWLTEHTLLPSDTWPLLLAALGAMCIGMSKAGLSGTSTLNVVLMAQIFGAKQSVGVILPMLIAADFMGFIINRKGGSWRRIVPMVPPAIAGVVVGVVIGWWILKRLPQKVFENVLFWLTAFAAVWLIRG
jgi:uncharacterized protein